MDGWAIKKFGSVDGFKKINYRDTPLEDGEVRIEVAASSINHLDIAIRSGKLKHLAPELPAILHGDVSGRVVDVADGVFNLRKGDEVFGFIGGVKGWPGALRDFVVVPEALVAKKPRTMSIEDAAALPLISLTAYELVIDGAAIKPGDLVLVHGGLGGVGHIVMQLAKQMKTTVAATIIHEKDNAEAKHYLADIVINAQKQKVAEYVKKHTAGEGFHCIIDTIGDDNLSNSLEAASDSGTIITTSSRTKLDLSLLNEKSLSLRTINTLLPFLRKKLTNKYQQILDDIAIMVDKGLINLRLDRNFFRFDDVAKGHAYVESGKARGKVILKR